MHAVEVITVAANIVHKKGQRFDTLPFDGTVRVKQSFGSNGMLFSGGMSARK
ncbi:hypothetical protein AA106556_2055 [Neokomagataea tanensis NBRC 106556]|uniref:Uncharacterized protein n=1 Tax=Neokomagataea tanensis NBRC 106556 TaxID=1223519 RepID=A0ABQ0QLL3_9PROT|nr:hypothetical protein AA106556_2055 [Neokomagataea tanensis NBRC 106556]